MALTERFKQIEPFVAAVQAEAQPAPDSDVTPVTPE